MSVPWEEGTDVLTCRRLWVMMVLLEGRGVEQETLGRSREGGSYPKWGCMLTQVC
jgi:hypothetical protein